MVESALAIPVLLAFLLFTLGFSVNVYRYLRMSDALRISGRIGAMQTQGALNGPGGCATFMEQMFLDQLGDIGLESPPSLAISVQQQEGGLRGLRVAIGADFTSYAVPSSFGVLHFSTDSFFPLEDQTACH